MKRVRDWVTTGALGLAVGLVCLVFDPVLRLARAIGMRPFEKVAWAWHAAITKTFAIVGVTVTVEWSQELQAGRGYLLVSNHQSMFDIPLLGGLLPDHGLKFVAKQSLTRRIPTISYYLRRGQNALIDRDNARQSLGEIRRMGRAAQERDVAASIFAEGTRSRDGEPGEFKRPGTLMLLRAAPELPVVPVTIDGSWRIFRHNLRPIPFGTTVRVRFGDPIERSPGEDLNVVAEKAEAEIRATLQAWRATTGDKG